MITQPIHFSKFIALDKKQQMDILMHCCACRHWAETVTNELKKIHTLSELKQLMVSTWAASSESDYLEAFAAHPKIGDIKVLQDKFAVQAHAEQGQVKQANQETLESLMQCNDEYYDKFGFIFIICASGKSADAMLSALKERLNNTREQELKNAALQQENIMLLRFEQTIKDEPTNT